MKQLGKSTLFGMQCTPATVLAFTAGIMSSLETTTVPAAAEGAPDELFRSVDAPPAMPAYETSVPIDSLATRRRLVLIDFGTLDRARRSASNRNESALQLNLFDDVSIVGVVEHTAPTFSGGYSLSGRIARLPLSSMTLVVNRDTVAGSVRTPDGSYHISSEGNGTYAISEVDVSELALDCDVLE